MIKYLVFLLMFCMSCKPTEPPQGYGLTQVTPDGLVDTDGDEVGDVEVEEWCPEPVLEAPNQAYSADEEVAEAVGFEDAYRFRLKESGEIDLCFLGETADKPLWWACNDGAIEVYGGGIFVIGANAAGLLATVDFLNYIDTDGVEVHVTGAKTGETTEGILWYEDSCK